MKTKTEISRRTRDRIAQFLLYGGAPLAEYESRIMRRTLALADGDVEDAAAILLVGAEISR